MSRRLRLPDVVGIDCGALTVPEAGEVPPALLRVSSGDRSFLEEDFFASFAVQARSGVRSSAATGANIDPRARIHPSAVLEDGVFVGPGSQIGPFAYLRSGTLIGAGCRIGFGVEVKESILCDGVVLAHLSYVGNSVIGAASDVGAGFVSAVQRLDRRPPRLVLDGKVVCETVWPKAGVIMGRDVIVGVSVATMPGTLLRAHSRVLPGLMIGSRHRGS